MLINLRNALMTGKRLPYDAEVEYLESTGTQWIDTGYSFNSATDSVELVFELLTTTPNYKWIFGAYDAMGLAIGSGDDNTRRTLRYNASTSYNSSTYYTAGAHIFLADSTGASIDGHNFFAFADFSTTSHILLYSLPIDTSTYCSNSRIWSYKHYRNGVLVRDYIPVRKGIVGYLYDRVSGKLFGNAGAGDFVLGPDVVPVEWLQSDGGQYIQTDFTPDDSYGFEVDCFTPVASSSYNSRAIGLQNGQVRWLYCTERRALSSSFFGWNEAVSVGSQPDKRIVARCNWLNNRTISIGDTVYKSNLATLDSVGGLKAVLFGINNGGSVLTSQLFVGKMYSAKVSVGNAIGYNYAPIRVGTEGAMMDTLTRRIYRNAGTGAFGYGNDLKYPIPAA